MLDMVYNVSITVEITMKCELPYWTLPILHLVATCGWSMGVDIM